MPVIDGRGLLWWLADPRRDSQCANLGNRGHSLSRQAGNPAHTTREAWSEPTLLRIDCCVLERLTSISPAWGDSSRYQQTRRATASTSAVSAYLPTEERPPELRHPSTPTGARCDCSPTYNLRVTEIIARESLGGNRRVQHGAHSVPGRRW